MKNKKTEKIPIRLMIIVISLAALTFLGILSETSLNIAYSALMSEFNVSASVIQWLTTGYLLLLAIAIPSSPFLVKKFSTKRLFQTAVITFMAGTLLGAIAPNYICLLLARLIMAAGTGISLPLITTIVLEEATKEQRGLLLGSVGLVVSVAPAVGPSIGGLIMEFLNWRYIFITMFPILLLSFLGGSTSITDIRKGEKAEIDVPSFLLSSISLSAIVIAFSMSGEWNWDIRIWLILAVGLLGIFVFSLRQFKLETPLIQLRIFKQPMFSTGIVMLMIAQSNILAISFLLPILLQKGMGYTSMIAALVLLPGAALGGLMSPIVGSLLSKYNPKIFIVTGFLIISAMLVIFKYTGYSLLVIVICYALFMFGISLTQIPLQTNTLNQLSSEHNADGSAIMNTLQQLSGAIGTALASGFLTVNVNSYLKNGGGTESAYIYGYRESLYFFIALCLLGFILSVFLRKEKNN